MDPGATEDYYALLGVDAGADGVVPGVTAAVLAAVEEPAALFAVTVNV